MTTNPLGVFGLILLFTIISGIGDSQGFVWASRVWQGDKFIWPNALRSGMGFAVGILFYWFAIRYLQKVGVVSAELQTLFWFSITIIGVAIVSRELLHWNLVDQGVAIATLAGIAWLLIRTGG